MAKEQEDNQCAPCSSCCVNTMFPRLLPHELRGLTQGARNVTRVDSEAALDQVLSQPGPAGTFVYESPSGYSMAQNRGACPQLVDGACKQFGLPTRPQGCISVDRGGRRCNEARQMDGKPRIIAPTIRRRGVGF